MTSIAGLRYVTPLFELAKEKSILDEVGRDIAAFSALIGESQELETLLLNPRIPARQKKEVILKLTEEGTEPLVRNFFCLLVDKGRERVFLFMEREYAKLVKDSRNIISATVQAPVPLDPGFKERLAERFSAMTGKDVELFEEHKPELIAGVRILLGSRMMDGSLKARLEGIKSHLIKSSAAKTG
jgi:F-type H+-transporting ATPase subunit delta